LQNRTAKDIKLRHTGQQGSTASVVSIHCWQKVACLHKNPPPRLYSLVRQLHACNNILMGCLHDTANVQQTSSKCIQNTRANAGRLLHYFIMDEPAGCLLDRVNTL